MFIQDIYLERIDWHVRIYYAVTKYYARPILEDLEYVGCHGEDFEKAKKNLLEGKMDSGLTYSDINKHESVIVIAIASEGAEYWNSIDHEKTHLLQHISLAYHINPYGEDICYISGEFIRDVYRVAKSLLCDCCRNKKQYKLTL